MSERKVGDVVRLIRGATWHNIREQGETYHNYEAGDSFVIEKLTPGGGMEQNHVRHLKTGNIVPLSYRSISTNTNTGFSQIFEDI